MRFDLISLKMICSIIFLNLLSLFGYYHQAQTVILVFLLRSRYSPFFYFSFNYIMYDEFSRAYVAIYFKQQKMKTILFRIFVWLIFSFFFCSVDNHKWKWYCQISNTVVHCTINIFFVNLSWQSLHWFY